MCLSRLKKLYKSPFDLQRQNYLRMWRWRLNIWILNSNWSVPLRQFAYRMVINCFILTIFSCFYRCGEKALSISFLNVHKTCCLQTDIYFYKCKSNVSLITQVKAALCLLTIQCKGAMLRKGQTKLKSIMCNKCTSKTEIIHNIKFKRSM